MRTNIGLIFQGLAKTALSRCYGQTWFISWRFLFIHLLFVCVCDFISDSQKLDNLKEARDAVLVRKRERHSKASQNLTFIRLCCLHVVVIVVVVVVVVIVVVVVDRCISRQDIAFVTEWLTKHGPQKLRDACECITNFVYPIL